MASFGKPRYSKDAEWELIRFATKAGTQVFAGLQKLIVEFARTHSGTLLSYANLRYSAGGVYEALGFRLVRRTQPSYWWCHPNGDVLSRYQCQKHRLPDLLDNFDETLSETENMTAHKYFKSWDCGNLVYLKDL